MVAPVAAATGVKTPAATAAKTPAAAPASPSEAAVVSPATTATDSPSTATASPGIMTSAAAAAPPAPISVATTVGSPTVAELKALLTAATDKAKPSNSVGRCHVVKILPELVGHLRLAMSHLAGGISDASIFTTKELQGGDLNHGGRRESSNTSVQRGMSGNVGSPSGRRYSTMGQQPMRSPTANQTVVFSSEYLGLLRSLLSSLVTDSGCHSWSVPPSMAAHAKEAKCEEHPSSSPLSSGWTMPLLKLHQLIVTLLPFVGAVEAASVQAEDDTKLRSPSDIWRLSAIKQTNASDVSGLMAALHDEEERNYSAAATSSGHLYMDYHDHGLSSVGETTTEVSKQKAAAKGSATLSATKKPRAFSSSSPWSAFDVFVVLVGQCWTEKEFSDTSEVAAKTPSQPSGYSRGVHWDSVNKRLVICLDLDVLMFSSLCCGRYDAYIWALCLSRLESAAKEGGLPLSIPDILLSSWQMIHRRAQHGLRAFGAVKFGDFVSSSRYDWLVRMLTGSPEAVIDGLTDLSDDLWNAQFAHPDALGTKKLEKLLVALLGHADKSIRSRATIMLNSLYDRHDWQTSQAFAAVVRSVADRFLLEITIDDETDPASNPNGPLGVFLILSAPSFIQSGHKEVYSCHAFKWRALDREGKIKDAKTRGVYKFATSAAGKKKSFKWVGVIDFGIFPRCGFFDWRVVRSDPLVGSWTAVHSTLAEIRRSASFASTMNASFCHIAFDSGGDAAGEDPSLAPFSVFPNPNMWGNQMDGDEFRQSIPLQGRFIVQAAGLGDEQIHEIFVDEHSATFTDDCVKDRGSFSSTSASFSKLRTQGITTVQLIGTQARDNGKPVNTTQGGTQYEREGASPFAVTCRATPNEMLGGHDEFSSLMAEAQRTGIKVFVDTLSRVSSTRPHKKYVPHMLQTLDDTGKKIVLYGTDGRSVQFEETCQLNYRDSATWRLMVDDIVRWVEEYNINGVKLDNAQSWPAINIVVEEELSRRDADGSRHYTLEEQLIGNVVVPFTEARCGYWDTAVAERYPNPLFVKLSREMWRRRAEFTIVAECVGPIENSIGRPGILARSGVVPQLQGLPNTLAKIFGKTIVEGRVESLPEPASILELRDWFDSSHENFPEGGIAIQSTCSHMSPFPSLLYGRGAWPAVDLLFFLPDIPATFGGEIEGRSYRLDIANVFEVHEDEVSSPTSSGPSNAVDFDPKTRIQKKNSQSTIKSALNLTAKHAPSSGGTGPLTKIRGLTSFESLGRLAQLEKEHQKRLGPEFGFDLSKIAMHYTHRRRLRHLFRIFREGTLVPLQAHSENQADWQQRVLAFARFDVQTGEFAVVVINFSEDDLKQTTVSLKGLSRQYFAMGLDATAIFEYLDLFELPRDFGGVDLSSVSAENDVAGSGWLRLDALQGTAGAKKGLISLAELLSEPQRFDVKPFSSICVGFRLISTAKRNPEVLQQLYSHSLNRFENLTSQIRQFRERCQDVPRHLARAVESNFIFASLSNALRSPNSIDPLADVLHHVWLALQGRPGDTATGFYDLLVDCGLFSDNTSAVSVTTDHRKTRALSVLEAEENEPPGVLLFAKLQRILQGSNASVVPATPPATNSIPKPTTSPRNLCGAVQLAKAVVDGNALGPIVFVTSELGKWSTVGGLGVMVDELSCTLAADFGQEVWVISPYYDRNRKGETGYLAKDDITYRFNVEITVGGEQIILGIHEGTVRGVRVFFMHNARFFPMPYPDTNPAEGLYYLSVMGKGALEILCHIRHIPQVLVTNDWPTGLLTAFAKQGHFGETFQKTTFFHIVHNLDPAYEGRIYPDRREDLTWIPGLPRDLLVDPTWAQFLYNPSRCALLSCDAWGTVSQSYRNDLTGKGNAKPSPLMPILQRYPTPFAFPNGIPIRARVEKLAALKTNTHASAKEFLQKKYFGFETADDTIPLFAFIGRITEQKGVHLITEAAESVIPRYGNKVQFLVGGMVNWRDPYSARVGRHLISLHERYPWSFWAGPNEFFTDGAVVNLGADIGLMPSAFEPGGIVQHEFFVAGTPVLAFCTGGLKDTVFEYSPETNIGNGFNFLSFSVGDLLYAIERACRVFDNKEQYARLRVNAREAVISCVSVAGAWLAEFCRLRHKVAIDPSKVSRALTQLPQWSQTHWASRHAAGVDFSFSGVASVEDDDSETPSAVTPIEEPPSLTVTPPIQGPIRSGPPPRSATISASREPASEVEPLRTTPTPAASIATTEANIRAPPTPKKEARQLTTMKSGSCPISIRYSPGSQARRPRGVALSGSFDKWAVRRPMAWDPAQQAFILNLALPQGKHFYKIVVDGVWMLNPGQATEVDASGNANNVIAAGV